MCFKPCAQLTNGDFPYRLSAVTCCKAKGVDRPCRRIVSASSQASQEHAAVDTPCPPHLEALGSHPLLESANTSELNTCIRQQGRMLLPNSCCRGATQLREVSRQIHCHCQLPEHSASISLLLVRRCPRVQGTGASVARVNMGMSEHARSRRTACALGGFNALAKGVSSQAKAIHRVIPYACLLLVRMQAGRQVNRWAGR